MPASTTRHRLTQVLERMRTILALLATFLALPALAGESCDISCKIERALQGDGEAALEVAQESRRTQTPEIFSNWLQIAAENGNVSGQWEFGNWLVKHSQSRYDCIRAVYWFSRAGQSGHVEAGKAQGQVQAFLGSHLKELDGCRDAL